MASREAPTCGNTVIYNFALIKFLTGKIGIRVACASANRFAGGMDVESQHAKKAHQAMGSDLVALINLQLHMYCLSLFVAVYLSSVWASCCILSPGEQLVPTPFRILIHIASGLSTLLFFQLNIRSHTYSFLCPVDLCSRRFIHLQLAPPWAPTTRSARERGHPQ